MVHLNYLSSLSIASSFCAGDIARIMTRPAALGAGQSSVSKVKRKKTPFPNAANITVASCRKAKKGKTTQHSGSVAPRYRLASGPALMAKAPSLVFLCGIGTMLVGLVGER